MQRPARLAIGVMLIALFLGVWPRPVAACTGGDVPLAAGIRGATSIFYGRIVGDRESASGFHDLQLDVGRLVLGRGQTNVRRVVGARACESFSTGDAGILVIGSVDPFEVGTIERSNLFYVLGPGRLSQAEAARVLDTLPATDTAGPTSQPASQGPPPIGLPALAALAVGLLVFFAARSGSRQRSLTRPAPRA